MVDIQGVYIDEVMRKGGFRCQYVPSKPDINAYDIFNDLCYKFRFEIFGECEKKNAGHLLNIWVLLTEKRHQREIDKYFIDNCILFKK